LCDGLVAAINAECAASGIGGRWDHPQNDSGAIDTVDVEQFERLGPLGIEPDRMFTGNPAPPGRPRPARGVIDVPVRRDPTEPQAQPALIQHILQQAVERGEIDGAAISNELWDLLPGYLIFRSIITSRPPARHTVQALVDDVIIPSLTRPAG
jgi:hypothetical protein